MTKQNHTNTALDTTLSAAINGVTGTIPVVALVGWPSVPFFAVIDPGSATDEEVVLVTNVVGTTFTVTRGADGTTAKAHVLGAIVRFCAVAFDLEGWILGGREVSNVAPVSGDLYVFNGTLWVPTGLTESVQDIVGSFLTAAQRSLYSLTYDDTAGTMVLDQRDAWYGFDQRETFINGLGAWTGSVAGTGATVSLTTATDQSHPGTATMITGTDPTGVACLAINASNLVTSSFGTGPWLCQAIGRLPTLSDGTNTYRCMVGYKDDRVGAGQDCVMITYSSAENGGRFSAECRFNGSSAGSVVDLGVTVVANTWYHFEILVNAAATSAIFNVYSDAVPHVLLGTATIVTNIPNSAARLTSPMMSIEKSLGGTSRTFQIDIARYNYVRTS